MLAVAPNYWWYAAFLIPVGLTSLTVMTAANASVQLSTEPVMRGRVMALYQAIFLGGTPLGAPVLGWVGDAFGPRWTLAIGAIACALTVVVAVAYLVRRDGWGVLPWVHAEDELILEPPKRPADTAGSGRASPKAHSAPLNVTVRPAQERSESGIWGAWSVLGVWTGGDRRAA